MINFTRREKGYLKCRDVWSFYKDKDYLIYSPFNELWNNNVEVLFDNVFAKSPKDVVNVLKQRNGGLFGVTE